MNKTLIALLMATSVLAACDGGGSTPASPPPPPPPPPGPGPGPTGPTGPGLADVIQGLFRTTSDTALPIDINGLDIDNTSEVPTLYDNLLI